MGSLTVTAQARDGTWAELWHLSGDQGKNWHLKSINLPPGSQAVKFASVAGYVYSDLAIDDVKCEAAAITTTTTGSLSPSPSPVPVTTVTSTTSSSPPPNGGMAITMSFCVKGQVGSDWAALFHSSDNSQNACASKCAATSGCVAFDYTSLAKSDACRGASASQTPMVGNGGGDDRQYCTMTEERVDASAAATFAVSTAPVAEP